MATRRHAREWALQLLFQLDLNPAADLDAALADFWAQQWRALREQADELEGTVASGPELDDDDPRPIPERVAPAAIRDFMERLTRGVRQNLDAIDERIARYADNWPLHRMGAVDRNVLRLAIYELFFEEQAPPVVCINEAVDLAKYFSSTESGKFVNGILDRACKDVTRPSRVDPSGGKRRKPC